MKKIMFFTAFAALLSLASCQEQITPASGTEDNIVSTVKSSVFTATIKPGATKTTLDLSDGKLAWETTDEITVTDAARKSAVYSIQSIDETSGKATFEIKAGETALGDGPYTAAYGTEPATEQTYSATAGKLYMTASETSANSLTFTVQCGLMKLNLTKNGVSVKSIAVTGTTSGGNETTYTLICDPEVSISTSMDFCIALPAGNYSKIEIVNVRGEKCSLNSTNGVAVAANHIKPVTFDESKLVFEEDVPGLSFLSLNDDFVDDSQQGSTSSTIWGVQW